MRNSRRIKRMGRNRVKIGKMNLTSLMDVFTILVFFLLVNSGSVEILDAPKEVTLPESRVESKPRETVVIFISPEEVLVQGKLVARVEDIVNGEQDVLDPIHARLADLKDNVIGTSTLTVAGQSGSHYPRRQICALHGGQNSHVDLHKPGLRKRVTCRHTKVGAGRVALTPHGRR